MADVLICGSEIFLIPETTFNSFPPKCFQPSSSGEIETPRSSVVTVIGDSKDFSNFPKISVVTSLADIEEVRHQIYRRPLVFKVTCGKHVPMGQKLNRKGEYLSIRDLEWWYQQHNTPWGRPYTNQTWGTGDTSMYGDLWIMPNFVMSVDTSHSTVRRKLEEGFNTAEALVIQGKKFSIEFNFNSLILEWWKRQGPARYDQLKCLTLTQATGASFTMTNHSALNHCFDCHPLWCACWPVYCVTAIPYKVWRNWVNDVSDVIIKMEGEISVARPNAIGYDLGDLHRAAAVQKTEPQEVQQR
ncbi:uncharacterized protein LOC116601144 [Nematostella vectensis]|uniref:uncharacterized protein LOC116601144 n=1 Tax=Nematostella vectensis TaxID=45351 RepID=UPI0020777E38|nr:uncharacterized protein LOC116601144 [Nematostella vectensis]XP_048577941.1 uncharacterized protein LOC116601144 [Nematostella vectensis]